MFRCSFRVLLGCRGFWLRAGSKNQREHVTPLKNTWEHQTRVKANVRQKFNLSNVEDGSSLMWATLPLTTSIWGMVHTIHYWVYHILTGLKNDDSRLSPKRPCLCRRTFYRPTNWGRVGRGGVGWGVIAFVTTASPRQTQWFVVQIHSKSPMEMGTHWLRLADRHWQSCKISHAAKRKGHFDRSPGFEAQNPVRVANHSKTGVFFWWLFATWNRAGATAQQFF